MNIEIIESPYVYNLGVTVASSFLLNPLGILGDPNMVPNAFPTTKVFHMIKHR
jgi:hypothetical protein